jgi:septum formation protein
MGAGDATGPIYFVLASGSPRRRELLGVLGIPFVVVRPSQGPAGREIDETPWPGETPPDLVRRLSLAKAAAVLAMLLPPASRPFEPPVTGDDVQAIVVAADTIVVVGDDILGKPGSPAQAVDMLKRLRRQAHQVYSGLTIAVPPGDRTKSPRFVTRLHRSTVWMRPYGQAEIEAYVASGDPLDKAGAYAIQHSTFAPVARLEGCYASVMGLPLGELAAALAEIGLNLPDVGARCSRYTGQPCCLT